LLNESINSRGVDGEPIAPKAIDMHETLCFRHRRLLVKWDHIQQPPIKLLKQGFGRVREHRVIGLLRIERGYRAFDANE